MSNVISWIIKAIYKPNKKKRTRVPTATEQTQWA